MPRAPYFLCVALFAALVLAKFDPETGFTPLIRFGETWKDRRVPHLDEGRVTTFANSHGYDGQFYAQIALDPLLRDPSTAHALDAPSYRARRIFPPALAFTLGLGQPNAVLQIYALLNVACWFAFAWLLYRELAPPTPHAFARWFACLFSMGVLESVRLSLTDLPALLLLLLAARACRVSSTGRTASGWLALSHLTKETNLLASVALFASPKPTTSRILWFAASIVPLALWLIYVSTRFPGDAEAGTGNFTWPFAGLVTQLAHSAQAAMSGHPDSRHVLVFLAVIGFATQVTVLWRSRDLTSAWWRIGAIYGLLLIFLSTVVWSGYWAVTRVVLPLTIAFNLLLPAGRAFWLLWALGNLSLLHGVWRFL